jgi:hypothetical protein
MHNFTALSQPDRFSTKHLSSNSQNLARMLPSGKHSLPTIGNRPTHFTEALRNRTPANDLETQGRFESDQHVSVQLHCY